MMFGSKGQATIGFDSTADKTYTFPGDCSILKEKVNSYLCCAEYYKETWYGECLGSKQVLEKGGW